MSFSKIATLFLALAFVGQAANASTNPFRGDRRKLEDAKVDQLMQVETTSKGKSSSSSEDCGGRMEPCCDGFKCTLPGLGCETYDNGSFVKYPVCKECGDQGDPCCQDECPKDGYGAKDTCSLSCSSGLTCSLRNQCVACGGNQGDMGPKGDKGDTGATGPKGDTGPSGIEPCCVDGEGKESCKTGFVCKLGQCMQCGDRDGSTPQPCCVDCEGKKFCDRGRVCIGGECMGCGGERNSAPQPCCKDEHGNTFCDTGRTCVGGLCQECGSNTKTCCVDSLGHKFCNQGHACINNLCRLCGGNTEPCCEEGAQCDVNHFCNAGTGRCEKCGLINEACCPDGIKCRGSPDCSPENKCE